VSDLYEEEETPGNIGAVWTGWTLTAIGCLLYLLRNQMFVPVWIFYTIMITGAICAAFGIKSNKRTMAITALVVSIMFMIMAALGVLNRREVLHTN